MPRRMTRQTKRLYTVAQVEDAFDTQLSVRHASQIDKLERELLKLKAELSLKDKQTAELMAVNRSGGE